MYTLLEMMLKDMDSAPALYQPTQFWKHGVQKIVDDLYDNGFEQFRTLSSVQSFFSPKYSFPDYYVNPDFYVDIGEKIVGNKFVKPKRWKLEVESFLSGKMKAYNDYRLFIATSKNTHPYLDRITESTVGDPVEQFVFQGRRFSRSMLNYLLGVNYLKRFFDLEDINTVLEIGGGYGTLGEILLQDQRNHCFYLNVDIPPAGFISTYYLKKVIGADLIGDYGSLKSCQTLRISDLAAQYKGVVLCPWQLPEIEGAVDLFVNFISFQEMEPEVVQNYFIHVRRLNPKYILLRNLREGKPKVQNKGGLGVETPILGRDYDQFLPDYHLVDTNTTPFGYKTEDGFHSELRIYQKR